MDMRHLHVNLRFLPFNSIKWRRAAISVNAHEGVIQEVICMMSQEQLLQLKGRHLKYKGKEPCAPNRYTWLNNLKKVYWKKHSLLLPYAAPSTFLHIYGLWSMEYIAFQEQSFIQTFSWWKWLNHIDNSISILQRLQFSLFDIEKGKVYEQQ